MDSWRKVWREGLAPLLSTASLKALERGLATDDKRIIQGATTTPPPLHCVAEWPVEAGCALGYCGASELGGLADIRNGVDHNPTSATVAEVEEFFARLCFAIDERLGEPAACRYWLNYWDETPRYELFKEVLQEVRLALKERKDGTGSVAGGNDGDGGSTAGPDARPRAVGA